MDVMPGAEPWSADGNDIGILLLHGFIDAGDPLNPCRTRMPISLPSADQGSAPGITSMGVLSQEVVPVEQPDH